MDRIVVEFPVWLELEFMVTPDIPATRDNPEEIGEVEIHDINGVDFNLDDTQKDHILERYESYFMDEIEKGKR